MLKKSVKQWNNYLSRIHKSLQKTKGTKHKSLLELAVKDQALTLKEQQLKKAQITAVQLKDFIGKVNLRAKAE